MLADLALEFQFDPVEALLLSLSTIAFAKLVLGEHAALLLDHPLVACRGFNRETLRKEKVSSISRTNSHYLSSIAEIIDIFSQKHFHVRHFNLTLSAVQQHRRVSGDGLNYPREILGRYKRQ